VAGCCERGDEPSGSCATELVRYTFIFFNLYVFIENRARQRILKGVMNKLDVPVII
jgi:hypothetical protein